MEDRCLAGLLQRPKLRLYCFIRWLLRSSTKIHRCPNQLLVYEDKFINLLGALIEALIKRITSTRSLRYTYFFLGPICQDSSDIMALPRANYYWGNFPCKICYGQQSGVISMDVLSKEQLRNEAPLPAEWRWAQLWGRAAPLGYSGSFYIRKNPFELRHTFLSRW